MNKYFLFLVLSWGLQVLACDCAMPDLKTSIETSASVFLGTVVGPSTAVKGQNGNYSLVSFSVEKSWKGIKGIKTQLRQGSSMCSFQFKTGEKYLVFSSAIGPTFTHVCSRTQSAVLANDDIEKLGKSIPLK